MSFCAVKPPGAGDYQAIGKQGKWLTLLATVDHSYSHEWGIENTYADKTAFADQPNVIPTHLPCSRARQYQLSAVVPSNAILPDVPRIMEMHQERS